MICGLANGDESRPEKKEGLKPPDFFITLSSKSGKWCKPFSNSGNGGKFVKRT